MFTNKGLPSFNGLLYKAISMHTVPCDIFSSIIAFYVCDCNVYNCVLIYLKSDQE